MYLFDTDHLTIMDRGGSSAQILLAKLSQVNPLEIATTIVSYEEQTRGWLSYTSAKEFERIRRLYPRLGTMDLKIAAISMTNNATLLTRNKSDFERIEGLIFEDWTS
mgnify:CR=1 FL=1